MIDESTFMREMGYINEKLDDLKLSQQNFLDASNKRFSQIEKQQTKNLVDIIKIKTHKKWAGAIITPIFVAMLSVVVYLLTKGY